MWHFTTIYPAIADSRYSQKNSKAVPTNFPSVSAKTRVDCTGRLKIELGGIPKDQNRQL